MADALSDWDFPSYRHYKVDFVDLEAKTSPLLVEKVRKSLKVIQDAYCKYLPDEITLAFNGGKDSVVLLHLIHVMLEHQHHIRGHGAEPLPRLRTIYFLLPNSFSEVTEFMHFAAKQYNLDVILIENSFQAGLQELAVPSDPTKTPVKAVFMGTRRADPHGEKLQDFAPCDPGWPPVMRVNPILDWNYGDIWEYIRAVSLPYCNLYDQGYTSIGSTHDTEPNSALFDSTSGTYRPAYELADGTLERKGRGKKKPPQTNSTQ